MPKALNLAKKKQTVAFSSTDNQLNLTCAAANLNIRNGVITGQDQFALETNALDILAGGTINLNQKTMDVVLQPTLADQDKANEILSFSKFIRISGPFNKLTPKVDTAQSSTALLQAGLNKLTNTETKQTVSDVSICQQVLGTAQTKTQTTSQKQPATAPKQGTKKTSAKPVSNKQKFQEQLVNTLFETLTAQ